MHARENRIRAQRLGNSLALDPPLRQLIRLRSEMALAAVQFTSVLFPERQSAGMIFGVVARVCLPDWTSEGRLARPAEAVEAISIRKIALSLGSSAESTRRHCNRLIQGGALVASSSGVALAATRGNEGLVLRYYTRIHDLLVRLIEDISSTCDIALPVRSAQSFGIADVIDRSIDMLLQPVDTFRLPEISRVGHLLWAGLAVVAVRSVTYDPLLCRRYSHTIPPDEVRQSISLRRLAEALGIPYATVWREAQALAEKGLATRVGRDEWSVLRRNLTPQSICHIAVAPTVLFLSKLRELTVMGLDPSGAADHYLLERPALANFGKPRRP